MEKSTRKFSDMQEKHIANITGGKITSNSGGTKFGGGDVLTDSFLIEAKTSMTEKQSFSIKREWLKKSEEQAFEQGKYYSVLAFQFEPCGENYYVVSEDLFLELLQKMEEN